MSPDGQHWPAVGAEQIDSVARSLLRLGIDRRGQLALTRLWDIAIRAAVLVDLRTSGRISDADDTTYVDESAVSGDHEDVACRQLVHDGFATENSWVMRGRLRAGDIAAQFVAAGDWTSRVSLSSPGMRLYRAPKLQLQALYEHLLTCALHPAAVRSQQEAALVALADALLVLGPARHGELALRRAECGPFEDVVTHAVVAIGTLDAVSRVNPGSV